MANDVSPSKTFDLLAEELSGRKHTVVGFHNRGSKDPMLVERIKLQVGNADAVILGISHPTERAKPEIEVAECARDLEVPFGYWSDTFGAFARPQITHLRDTASFVFCINEAEAQKARGLFPNATTFGTGSPLWEEFFTPKVPREVARKKLGVHPETKVILSPGSKSLMVNILLWGCLVEAVSWVKLAVEDVTVLLSQHPGDNNPVDAYVELVRCSPVKTVFIGKSDGSTSDILPAADAVVEFASSIGIEAACQRIPIVNFFMHALLNQRGIESWDLCNVGASYEAINAESLWHLIEMSLINPDRLRAKQVSAFPQPPEGSKGAAVKAIADAFEHLMAIKAQHMVT